LQAISCSYEFIGRKFHDNFSISAQLAPKRSHPNILCSGQAQVLHRKSPKEGTGSAAVRRFCGGGKRLLSTFQAAARARIFAPAQVTAGLKLRAANRISGAMSAPQRLMF
jgi:hypothetical protein